MINPIITNNVINNASTEALKTLAKEIIKHIDLSYDYNDTAKNEILNILITGKFRSSCSQGL